MNPEQREAMEHNEGPLLILAGAGSGKTTVLVARTGRLIAEGAVSPKEICLLTFTNKAAREIKERVQKKIGDSAQSIWAGTFHSFGLQLLRKYHKQAELPKYFGVIDSSDAQAVVKDVLKNFKHYAKQDFDIDKLLLIMGDLRALGRVLEGVADEYAEAAEVILPRYISRLRALGVVDFDGLLLKPLEIFASHPEVLEECQRRFKQVMVDEFQDTNRVQMKLIKKLTMSHMNITVVGDDDQSIYGWRGAEINNILNFPRLFDKCKVVRLERNYRSVPTILNVANSVIQKNTKRHDKVLRPDPNMEKGEKPEVFVYENEEMESEQIVQQILYFYKKGYDYRDMAVLYRSNGQGGLLEGGLRHHSVPYSLSGGTAFFDRREIKDILAYLRCGTAPHEVAFRRILNTPARGVGDVSIGKIELLAQAQKLTFFAATKKWREAGVDSRAGENIETLLEGLKKIPERLLNARESIADEVIQIMRDFGYYQFVFQNSKGSSMGEKKWNMIEIFSRVAENYIEKEGKDIRAVRKFIDSMELRDKIEDGNSEAKSEVQLLTFHACKGLEYPVVFMVGVEEDIIPHRRLGGDIDEERRLFYVGVTRAMKRLIITRSCQRKRFGKMSPSVASRFLLEIPEKLLTVYESGFRPVQAEERDSMVSSFLAQLDKKIEKVIK